jgi:hypothetical protein
MLLPAAVLCAALAASPACADSEEDLAKTSQNPVGDMISLPFELNVMSGVGPSESTAYVLNVKPVYPVRVGKLNLINRLILPVIYAEGQDVTLSEEQTVLLGFGGEARLANGSAFGLGDATYQAFFSPAEPGPVIWGIGPAFVLPPRPTTASPAISGRRASPRWRWPCPGAGWSARWCRTSGPSPETAAPITSISSWSSPSPTTTWTAAGTSTPPR